MNFEQISLIIRQYIKENFLFNSTSFDLSDDSSFIESGIIDSTGVLEVVNFIQEKFSMTVEDHEMLPQNLDSIKNISNFIENKIANR